MAAKKHPKTVRVRARLSFDNVYEGDESETELTEKVQRYLDAGLLEVVGDGTDPAGPGGSEPDDDQRDAEGAAGGGAAGRQPGEGFGTGSYGSPAGVDQG
jgi:hypothetical protein